jgi:hypothetical protein
MQSPCKTCKFKKMDKRNVICDRCSDRWDAVKEWESENPFPVYGDNTPVDHSWECEEVVWD